MNVALALWGTLSAAEVTMLDSALDDLLRLFLREYRASGGPDAGIERLKDHMCLFIATMAMAWLMDAPALIQMQLPDLNAVHDRFDSRFKANETARTQLHMLTNVLHLWQTLDFGEVLERIPLI
jgi:hypothetical protein